VGENAISRGNECSSIRRSAIVFSSFSQQFATIRLYFAIAKGVVFTQTAQKGTTFVGLSCLSRRF
jgi:hypothetical protein